MSRPGDVVWADGRFWLRRHNSFGGVKMWWMSEGSDAWGWHTLAYLRTLDDFRWLVRDGKRQHSYPGDVAMLRERVSRQKEAIQSYQETVRELAANVVALTAERDAARTDLDEMTKARDAAAKGYLEKVSELENIRAELSGWSIWKTDEPEPPLAEQVRTLRDAWRDVANERDNAKRILLDKTAFGEEVTKAANEERAAIVAWLRGRPSGYYGGARLADSIKRGDHLGGDDE